MDDDLASHVLAAVGSISAELRSRFASAGEPDLGFVALATLRHLTRHGSRSVSELAKADRVTTQAVSLRVAPLADAGLVTRSTDPADARRTLVEVTHRGRQVVERAQQSAHAALKTVVRNLTRPERTALVSALPVLHRIGTDLNNAEQL